MFIRENQRIRRKTRKRSDYGSRQGNKGSGVLWSNIAVRVRIMKSHVIDQSRCQLYILYLHSNMSASSTRVLIDWLRPTYLFVCQEPFAY